MNYFDKRHSLWTFGSFGIIACALSFAMFLSSCSFRTVKAPTMNYSRYKTIKIDFVQNAPSKSRPPTNQASLSPATVSMWQQGIANALQKMLADHTKLRIVNDDSADLRIGFYISKHYLGGNFGGGLENDLISQMLVGRNTLTIIEHVTITDNVINEKQELDISCNGFEGGGSHFVNQSVQKVAKATYKRILTMTK